MTTAANSTDVQRLESLLSAKRRALQQTKTLLSGDYYQRKREGLAHRIAALESELAALDSEYECGPAIIEQTEREIDVLVSSLHRARHNALVERFLAQAGKVRDLQGASS